MKKSKFLSLILLFSFVVSPLFGGVPKVQAQPVQTMPASSSIQAQVAAPNDEIGTSNDTGQQRTTTMAMRIATALHLNLNRSGTSIKFAGISPDTEKYSPLAKIGGALAQLIENVNVNLPDYFGVANWANSPLPQLDASGAVIPGTGIRKFVDTLPGFCGQPNATNSMGQCIPLGIADNVTFAGSDYYEIAVVEYRERMSPDLPLAGTKLRGYVQVVPWNYPGAVALTVANGLTSDILDRNGQQVYGAYKPHYLGPMIIATGCSQQVNPSCTPRPVRVKFTNYLPTGPGGDLFIPVDTTYMGAGMGPGGSILSINVTSGGSGYTSAPTVAFSGGAGTGAVATATVINGKVTAVTIDQGGSAFTSAPIVSFSGGGGTGAAATAVLAGQPGEMYTQNRATLHLHGGNTPWISDGTPHQWTTPYGEATSYSKGESSAYVPDMWYDSTTGNLITSCAGALTCAAPNASNDPGLGSLTFFWTNQQSGRLLFYHDHSYGITRLNVYAGEAAGYLIVDPAEENALAAGGVPGTLGTVPDLAHLIPLVIQDKTFVPDNGVAGGQLALTDPTWDINLWGQAGDLWFPHVYTPNQNPADIMGANAYGRWDYGPWFWPPQNPAGFSMQPYQCTSAAYPPGSPPAFPPLLCPGIPNPSGTPEAFMDTPIINGALYPTLTVDPTAYRFQMLMAGNDRTWNLALYVADPLAVAVTSGGANYTLPPIVGFTGGGGTGATAVAHMSNGSITSILITGPGHGYTVTPNVHITGNGTGAAATAVVDPVTTTILSIRITSGGSGYSSAAVTIDPPLGCVSGCVTASATATVTPPGTVLGITVTNPGSGWTGNPTVTFTNAAGDTTGAGAAAIASVNSEVKMVSAVPHDATSTLPLCANANPTSGAMLVTALLDGTGNPLNGTGLPAGCWPSAWPTDGRDGGVPDPLQAGPPFIQIGTESGLLPHAVVIPSTPVGFEYNRRSITVLNVFTHGLLLGPAERADVVVDFSQYAGKTLVLYNDAPAPVPAFDPRNDYYTGDPDQTLGGGAPTTLPGYGPNTRTIMQIKVNAVAGGGNGSLGNISVTSVGAGYSAPTVSITGGGGAGATAIGSGSVDKLVLTNAGTGYVNPVITFSGGGGSGASAAFTSGALSGLTLTAPGAGYSSMPAISFTGGGGSLAAATAYGSVDTVALTAGGAGYATTAVNLAGGGGSGATASATGAVNAVAVTNGGGGYAAVPTINFTGGGGSGATASATGGVDAIAINNPGGGYATMPAISFSGGGGTGAAATASGSVDVIAVTTPGAGYVLPVVTLTGNATAVASGGVYAVIVTAGGTNYKSPVVSFTGGGGSGASATANTDKSGVITSIVVNTPGSGYTSAPVVNIVDSQNGNGTGATATSTISLTSIAVTSGGTGYTAAPAVTITDNGGTPVIPAAASATLLVSGITINAAGSGYTSAPAVTFATGLATGTATLLVNAIAVTAPGSGYTSAPAVVFSSGTAAATASLTITAVTLGLSGSGYSSVPSVTFTGGGTGATASVTLRVSSMVITSPGSGYTSAPTVVFSGGGGSGAAATASISATGIQLLSGGSNYTSAPLVTISDTPPGAGTGATAVATINVNNITLTNPGAGYTSLPAVGIADTPPGTGAGATAVANMVGGIPLNITAMDTAVSGGFVSGQNQMIVPEPDFPVGNGNAANPTYVPIQGTQLTGWFAGPVGSINLLNGGSNYSSAPTVSFQGGGGSGATAALTFGGATVNNLSLTAGGSGYTSVPSVSITGGGGTGATGSAFIAGPVGTFTVTNRGSGYSTAPTVTVTGGGGTGATGTAVLTSAVFRVTIGTRGSGYTSAPTVVFSGGGGSGATAVATIQNGRVQSVTVTWGGSGYTSNPTVSFTGGGGSGATATATRTNVVNSITLTNGGSGYNAIPTVTLGGGGGTGATATASINASVVGLLLTNGGSGYTSNPLVSFSGGGGSGAAATAAYLPGYVVSLVLTNPGSGYTSAPSIIFSGGGTPSPSASAVANPPVTEFKAKAIQELFTLDYGRMNATLGVELPFTNFFIQTTIPYGYIDPPTEMFQSGEIQIWKITHNGVDTHFIHFHLYDVQVLNRVGWDGMIKPPDVNEIAWKDTVRMNPLEDIIIALRPMKQNLPWELPNSLRPMDVTQSIGVSNPANTMGFANIDPGNNPATVNNDVVNYGWEYVVHCHILGHEENDMMRAQILAIAPDPVTNVTATRQGTIVAPRVLITWVDGSNYETGFTVQRATAPGGPWLSLTPSAPAAPGKGTAMSFTDTTVARRTTYYYRVVANNVVGYTQGYAAPAIGYPTLSADSAPVAASAVTINSPLEEGPIFADSFETGLNLWSGIVGNSNVISNAVIGPNGGDLGMVASVGVDQQPAYVYDTSPASEVMYAANFYFNPNSTLTAGPVDIFLGIDQNSQAIFGIQYQYLNANSFQVRAWVMHSDGPEFTAWDIFSTEPGEDDPMSLTHKLDVAWVSGSSAGFSFYVDDRLFSTLNGDTSASQLEEVILGPALGLSAADSGSMYFDEFTSSRLMGLTYVTMLPVALK